MKCSKETYAKYGNVTKSDLFTDIESACRSGSIALDGYSLGSRLFNTAAVN